MQVSVIIPSLNRAQKLIKVLDNLAAVTDDSKYEAIVLLEQDDSESWAIVPRRKEKFLLIPNNTTPINAWNQGLRAAQYEWVLLGADDIVFPPNWLENCSETFNQGFLALQERETPNHNWEPHFLLSKAWMKKHQNGVLTIPHYAHWGTDVETCERAVRSNTFTRARNVVIAHNHWAKDPSLEDSTYAHAKKFHRRDMSIFEFRKSLGFPDDFESIL